MRTMDEEAQGGRALQGATDAHGGRRAGGRTTDRRPRRGGTLYLPVATPQRSEIASQLRHRLSDCEAT